MTYLEIVNKVLVLMREPFANTLKKGDDVVVDIVAQQVNDAKRSVESAHNWNVLRHEWTVLPAPGDSKVELAGTAGRGVVIEEIYGPTGDICKELPTRDIRRLMNSGSTPGLVNSYAVSGVNPTTRNIEVQFHPEPQQVTSMKVYGWRKQPDLVLESDVLLVPAQPVIYMALALATRERGEVGGQTAAEIFGMAGEFLKDAIAQDVALNQYDYDWHVG